MGVSGEGGGGVEGEAPLSGSQFVLDRRPVRRWRGRAQMVEEKQPKRVNRGKREHQRVNNKDDHI